MLTAFALSALLAQVPVPEVIVQPPMPTHGQLVASRVAIAAQMVTAGLDYGTTMYALGTGRLVETNPVWGWAQDNPVAMGSVKLGIHAAMSAVLLHEHKRHPKRTFWIALGVTALNTWATWHNARQIKRVKQQ